MSKEVKYYCDKCNKVTDNAEYDGWLTIGVTEGHELYAKSPHRTMNRFDEIHYCSSECLSSYFFPILNKL